jgi:thymidylate synthase (FAD)
VSLDGYKCGVLDHGYVQVVESWGSDEAIVEAARMSTGKGFLGWGELRCSCGATSTTAAYTTTESASGHPRSFRSDTGERCTTERGGAHVALPDAKAGDEKLLRYLWEHKHATPFEMAGLVVEVQAPIFVFREWHRHRTQSYNEMSARYVPLPDVNYVPTVERLLANSKSNKQAGTITGADELTPQTAEAYLFVLRGMYEDQENLYQGALKSGVPKELARIHLPVGRYSRMRASANLRNWLAFLTLRMAPEAQWEIRQFANAVGVIVAERFPRTWRLFPGASS